jgi:hypothetical protein
VSEGWDARLKRLPPRRAPAALKGRVLAAAALRARPWHARPWWTWSLPARAAFVAGVALAAAAALALAGPAAARLSELSAAVRLEALAPLGRALAKVLWLTRLPLAALALMSAAPAAALAGLAAATRARSRPWRIT